MYLQRAAGKNECITYLHGKFYSVPGIFPGVKDGRFVGLTLLSSFDHCLEIWEPQPPGTLRACPGQYRACFLYVKKFSMHIL
jgi:hypothetical protein